jgi:hypothetical protein
LFNRRDATDKEDEVQDEEVVVEEPVVVPQEWRSLSDDIDTDRAGEQLTLF